MEDISGYNELSTNIRVYFEKLIFNSSLEIEQGEEIDMSSLLKLGDFKIHVENDDILEKFVISILWAQDLQTGGLNQLIKLPIQLKFRVKSWNSHWDLPYLYFRCQ